MIAVATSYDIPPLRCQECNGTGRVDGTREYLDQLFRGGKDDVVYMGGEPHLKACYVCSGTGRHVSRARAGLAAPPITYVDIETRGLDWRIDPKTAAQDAQDLADAMSLMRIIDDPVRPLEDEAAARERIRSWFDTPFPYPAGAEISIFHTLFRPYPDWWSKSVLVADEKQNLTREAREKLAQEHPPIWPEGKLSEAEQEHLNATLELFNDAKRIVTLGDPYEGPITDAMLALYHAEIAANPAGIVWWGEDVESVEDAGATTQVFVDGVEVKPEEPK